MPVKTERLYYDNAYLLDFDAEVVDRTQVNGKLAVALNRSAFYPTSGGQPFDVGTLNAIAVSDVVVEGDTVLHITENPIEAGTVQGQVDWTRRFDHMRHHTGQHILTRAFIEVAGAETIGFHLSDNSVTIDLNRGDLTPAKIDTAEDLANQIVAENRTVRAWFPEADELAGLALRKISEKVTGAVRVVDVGGFDVTACGGTHVGQTAEIGLIKVMRADKKGDTMRVEFRCGSRALNDYREKNGLLNDLATQFTTGYANLPDVLGKLRDENKELSRALKAAREQLMGYEVQALWNEAFIEGRTPTIIKQVFEERPANELQWLANQLISNHSGVVVLLGMASEKAHLVFARSEDVSLDVVPLLKQVLSQLGSERGGGRPNMAQGGGVPATKEQIEAALAEIQI
jgi:alanyl-tRNA synthetase